MLQESCYPQTFNFLRIWVCKWCRPHSISRLHHRGFWYCGDSFPRSSKICERIHSTAAAYLQPVGLVCCRSASIGFGCIQLPGAQRQSFSRVPFTVRNSVPCVPPVLRSWKQIWSVRTPRIAICNPTPLCLSTSVSTYFVKLKFHWHQFPRNFPVANVTGKSLTCYEEVCDVANKPVRKLRGNWSQWNLSFTQLFLHTSAVRKKWYA